MDKICYRTYTQYCCSRTYSRKILEKFVWTAPIQPSITELGWFRFNIARIDHETGTPIVISRTGYTGELGYEIWCHPKDANEVWDKVWEAGKEFDITPLGLEALDMAVSYTHLTLPTKRIV